MSLGLTAETLTKAFQSKLVLKGISFELKPGEIVGLLGPNGAGKTTSFYMMVGLLKPDTGRVFLNDKDITHDPLHKRAQYGISYLPQHSSIFRKMTVADNLLAIMEIANIPYKIRKEYLFDLLEKFQIEHIKNTLGISLSGGERRRVEIARSLIIKPKFLLLDEPFAGIDPVTVSELQKILLDLKQEGLGILITDHNIRETLQACDRVYVVFQGKILAHGTPQEIVAHKQVQTSYLGESFVF